MKIMKGFTLIELMVVVIVIAVIAAIALPSYAAYVRKNHEKLVLQKMGDIALKLEKEKSRNFSYNNFPDADIEIMKNPSSSEVVYTVSIDPQVQTWTMKGCVNSALDNASRYKNFAQNSKGAHCEWSDTSCNVPDECK